MNIEIHDGSCTPMEIHITHTLSDRDMMRIRKDIEPGDGLAAMPGNGFVFRPSKTIM